MFTTAEPDQLPVLEAWLEKLGGGKKREPDAPKPKAQAQADTAPGADHELREMFRELIVSLSRKNIVSDSEAMAMLRKLSK